MKKIYLLVFSLIGVSQINAQITLTKAANEPVIGDSYDSKGLDSNNTALPMNISGTNVTWNITNIIEAGGVLTNTFIPASADPNSSNYPGTTIVQSDGNSVSYFKSSPSLYELVGVDAGGFVLNYNSNAATIASYPITMGYINNDTGAGTIAVTAQSVTGTFTSTIQTKADGTGTLNFNSGTTIFTNCLRVKTVQHVDFNVSFMGFPISGTIDQSIYNYYVSGYKYPVFTVNYSNVNAPTAGITNQQQDNISALSFVTVGVKENKLNDLIFKTYPNPAQNEVNIHYVLTQNESYTFQIVNTFGQVVRSVSKPNLQPGMYNENIDLTGLSTGVYYVKVDGKNSHGVEKLIIQ